MYKKVPFFSNSKFYSDKHFPYGFARSGQFTREQSNLLERHGRAYEALHMGKQEPENEEESRFIRVCRGDADPVTEHEKVWMLYCKLIAKRPSVSPFGAIIKKSTLPIEMDEEKLSEDLEDF